MSNSQVKNVNELIESLVARITKLEEQVKKLEEPKTKTSDREMTDDDARNVLSGSLKDAKHKDAAEKLGLSYGQIYSCRLGYTFKNIHKEMKAAGVANPWIK
jgi:predicted Zn-dependent protease